MKIYTCRPEYLLESVLDPRNPGPGPRIGLKGLVIDLSLSEEIARRCAKLGLDYVGCSPDEKKCVALKRRLGFGDGYATGK